MTKRIFKTILIVAIGVFFACELIFMTVLYDYFSGVQQNQLKIQTDLASQGVKNEGLEYLKGLSIKDYRITWIGTDGSVLYDSISNPDEMENHFEREEVKEALSEGYGESTRYSNTLTQRYLYSAKRLDDGTVIRLSVTQKSLMMLTLGMVQPIFIIFIFVIILSIVLAYRLSKKIVKPLNELNLDDPLSNEEYDEISPLLRRIDSQQTKIKAQSDALRQKQSEFETVTKGMSEGIILLDSKGEILSLNRAANDLLGTGDNAIGKDILSVNGNLKITDLIRKAESRKYAEKTIELSNNKYRVSADPVISDDKISGIVLLILDVTEKEKAEEIRREFTANVSHELKTPLQTISGSAELMANNMVNSEYIVDFSKKIYTESQRMIRLVEDIIKLSHLDEGAEDMNFSEVDLYTIASETIDSLKAEADKFDISILLTGDHGILYCIPQLINSIIYNLCDNAIKYNKKGGSVVVSIKNDENNVILSVKDTGIGIPTQHQERIFERFYRVDKSHSKEIGGTGLGLSIVKHAVRLHNGTIDLKSVLGEGSEFIVKFSKT